MDYIVYLLDNTITAIAPSTVDPKAEGIVFDEMDVYMPGLQIGDQKVGKGQYERPVPVEAISRQISALDFKRRFALSEWVAADALRLQGDGVMRYFFDELLMVASSGDNVHLDHPNTVQGIGYMQSKGILTAERAATILSGVSP